jgi:hypothetical protein
MKANSHHVMHDYIHICVQDTDILEMKLYRIKIIVYLFRTFTVYCGFAYVLLRVHCFPFSSLCYVIVDNDEVWLAETLGSGFSGKSVCRMLCNYSLVDCDVARFCR